MGGGLSLRFGGLLLRRLAGLHVDLRRRNLCLLLRASQHGLRGDGCLHAPPRLLRLVGCEDGGAGDGAFFSKLLSKLHHIGLLLDSCQRRACAHHHRDDPEDQEAAGHPPLALLDPVLWGEFVARGGHAHGGLVVEEQHRGKDETQEHRSCGPHQAEDKLHIGDQYRGDERHREDPRGDSIHMEHRGLVGEGVLRLGAWGERGRGEEDWNEGLLNWEHYHRDRAHDRRAVAQLERPLVHLLPAVPRPPEVAQQVPGSPRAECCVPGQAARRVDGENAPQGRLHHLGHFPHRGVAQLRVHGVYRHVVGETEHHDGEGDEGPPGHPVLEVRAVEAGHARMDHCDREDDHHNDAEGGH
mmetsp:Transcript_8814/g.29155  ORF Transcript_8814/g.29155 Transcript_8814/m.29155 type:complete len:355 (-) Transcript_8814:705-1769(-)